MNNNEPIDFEQNQITRCIICHYNVVGPNILALCTRCHKSLIAYHKFNGITTMKNLDANHKALYRKYVQEVVITNCPRGPHAWEPLTKKAHITPSAILRFFILQILSRKTTKHKNISWKILYHLSSRVICHWRLLNPFNCKGWCIGFARKWCSHLERFLWKSCFPRWYRKPLLSISSLH